MVYLCQKETIQIVFINCLRCNTSFQRWKHICIRFIKIITHRRNTGQYTWQCDRSFINAVGWWCHTTSRVSIQQVRFRHTSLSGTGINTGCHLIEDVGLILFHTAPLIDTLRLRCSNQTTCVTSPVCRSKMLNICATKSSTSYKNIGNRPWIWLVFS